MRNVNMSILQMLTLCPKNHPKCGLLNLITDSNLKALFFSKKSKACRRSILSSDLCSSWLQNTILPLFQTLIFRNVRKSCTSFKDPEQFLCQHISQSSDFPVVYAAIHLSTWNRRIDPTASLFLTFVFTILLCGLNAKYLI